MPPKQHSITPRPLTESERLLTRWLIEHGTAADGEKTKYLFQLEHAVVTSRCPCGCASVDFDITGIEVEHHAEFEILGDFVTLKEGVPQYGIFAFAREGALAGFDIYTMGDPTPRASLPDPSELVDLTHSNQPNQSTDPTFSSGTPGAGHQPRHP